MVSSRARASMPQTRILLITKSGAGYRRFNRGAGTDSRRRFQFARDLTAERRHEARSVRVEIVESHLAQAQLFGGFGEAVDKLGCADSAAANQRDRSP